MKVVSHSAMRPVRHIVKHFGCESMACLTLWTFCLPSIAGEWTVEVGDLGAVVKLDGQFVTEYLLKSGAKPILWPIIGPTGKEVTRSFPMKEVGGEERDHEHHRSFWFTHGKVNGVDFWSELPGHGTIEHREFVETGGGDAAVIITRNDWRGPDGQKQCEDQRRMVLRDVEGQRWIDFSIVFTADPHPVLFGDVRDGSFGVRVASSMRVEANLGGKIVTSDGAINEAAFGTRSPWVDYHGPIDGETVGIAILTHPESFRAPHYWFVRPYGMFAVNPFGQHEFTGKGDGSYTLPRGKTLSLHYRVIIHRGDEKQGRIAAAFERYAEETFDDGLVAQPVQQEKP